MVEIFTTQSNYEIEQVVLVQPGKMCAELGRYVRLSDFKKLRDGVQNVLDQKDPKDSKWIIGFLQQLMTESG